MLRQSLATGSDPTSLLMEQPGKGAHSVTPFALAELGNGNYMIEIYDNNYSNVYEVVRVVSTTLGSSWLYRSPGGPWSGDDHTHSLGGIPFSIYNQPAQCVWCQILRPIKSPTTSAQSQIWMTGQVHLLITDPLGRKLGYSQGQYLQEIPSASYAVPFGGLGIPQEPIYTLPGGSYNILLDGETLTQTQTASIAQFGAGYASVIDGITVIPSSRDNLSFLPDGTQLSYQSTSTQAITMTLAVDRLFSSNQFQIRNATIGTGRVTTLTVSPANWQLAFNNSQNSGGTYDLAFIRATARGQQDFLHTGISIGATDTQYASFGNWNGWSITLQIDHGSKGFIDQILVLSNQSPTQSPIQILFPFITK